MTAAMAKCCNLDPAWARHRTQNLKFKPRFPLHAGVPYVFLLTDGAVDNERSICRHMEAYQARTPAPGAMHARVSTFAIGPFCNHFFLKQLAASGAAVERFAKAIGLSST